MRVSLNLYRQPNFTSSRIIKAPEPVKKKEPVSEREDILPKEIEGEEENAENVGIRPAVARYIWYKPIFPEVKPKPRNYDENLKKLNEYIVNTSPHEDFDAYPSNFEALDSNYGCINQVIHHFDNPRELVQYYTDYCNKSMQGSSYMSDTLKSMIANLDYKIDFDALGITEDDLSLIDKVKFAALFDFWVVTFDGAPRNGFERPPFVRSTKEYLDIMSQDESRYDCTRIERVFLLGMRLTKEEKEKDEKIQKALDAEREQILRDRKRMSFRERAVEPNELLSPINRMRALISFRLRRVEEKIEKRQAMIKDSEDMQKLWYEFIGGELD